MSKESEINPTSVELIKCHKNHDDSDMYLIDDSSVFHLGDTFDCYETLITRLENHSRSSHIHYFRRDSRTVKGAHMKTTRLIEPKLKYYYVKYACVYGGQKFSSRSEGHRSTMSLKRDCPSHIMVRADSTGKKLEVVSVCNHHNHLVNQDLYQRMRQDRKLPPRIKDEVLDFLSLGIDRSYIMDYVYDLTGKSLNNKDLLNLKGSLKGAKRKIPLKSIELLKSNVSNLKSSKLREELGNNDARNEAVKNSEKIETNVNVDNIIEVKLQDAEHCTWKVHGNYMEFLYEVPIESEFTVLEGHCSQNIDCCQSDSNVRIIQMSDYDERITDMCIDATEDSVSIEVASEPDETLNDITESTKDEDKTNCFFTLNSLPIENIEIETQNEDVITSEINSVSSTQNRQSEDLNANENVLQSELIENRICNGNPEIMVNVDYHSISSSCHASAQADLPCSNCINIKDFAIEMKELHRVRDELKKEIENLKVERDNLVQSRRLASAIKFHSGGNKYGWVALSPKTLRN